MMHRTAQFALAVALITCMTAASVDPGARKCRASNAPGRTAPHDLPIPWFSGPGVKAHNGAYLVSRAAIGKKS